MSIVVEWWEANEKKTNSLVHIHDYAIHRNYEINSVVKVHSVVTL